MKRIVTAVVAALVLAVAAAAFALGRPDGDGAVRVRLEGGRQRPITLVGGSADLGSLDEALAREGAGDAVVQRDGWWVLNRVLVVEPGAELVIHDQDLRLRSEGRRLAALEARGGDVEIVDSIVTSWDASRRGPDVDVSDGRPWILARDGSRLDVVRSTLRMLGYDAHERYGVSWRTEGTTGSVESASFVGNFYGMYTFDADPMTIVDSVVRDSVSYGLDLHTGSDGFVIERNRFVANGKHGLVLAVECRDAMIRDNVSARNGGHGFVVFDRSDRALLEGNEAFDNSGAGIDVSSSSGATIRDNTVHGNELGVMLHDRASELTVEQNRVAGNRSDGIRLASGATGVSVRGNLVDHNYRAGVYVDEGSGSIEADNRLVDNVVGIWVSDESGSLVVRGNTISGNIDDGVHLTEVVSGVTIEDNAIEDNRKAAFSTTAPDEADALLSVNRLAQNGTETRVRGA
ncbi:MAG TPA: right-handed parallel beta-helix repeat-containing protein [Actinomycetota bacterium]